MTMGVKLANARKAAKLTQDELAEKIGVTYQSVSAWERNETVPDVKKLVLLGEILHVSMNELLAEEDADWKWQVSDEQPLLEKAIEFATVKHAGVQRKGTTFPYITHVMEAMEIVSRLTDDEEIRAAAVLHDTLEDTETTKEELIRNFGQRVADLVAAESENKREGQPAEDTWEARKQETLDHLAKASTEIKMIALGDKLSNARAMYRDFQVLGNQLWKRFNQNDPAKQGRYYGRIVQIFGTDDMLRETPAYREYAELLSKVFGNTAEKPAPEEPFSLLPCTCFTKDTVEELPEGMTLWTPYFDDADNDDMLHIQQMAATLAQFLHTEKAGLRNVHLTLVNEPDSDDVTWKRDEDGYSIHLSAVSGYHWCQVAYQLGYALMHCLIDRIGDDGKKPVVWAEELICETVTLVLLRKLHNNWGKTPFGQLDPAFKEYVIEYLDENLSDQGTSAMHRCRSLDELESLNRHDGFTYRLDESHDLYQIIDEDDLMKLAEVRNFGENELLLDTHTWRAAAGGSKAVDYVCRLQERIPGCDVPMGIQTTVDLEDSKPTEEQREAHACMIRALQPHPCESVRFSFLDADKGECEQIGLVYYQVSRMKNGAMDVRLRHDTRTGIRMYRLVTDAERAAGILNDILETNDLPALEDWEDITTIPDSRSPELYPGIDLNAFEKNLRHWLAKPKCLKQYENAPSGLCKVRLALEYYSNGHDTEAVRKAIREVDAALMVYDMNYLYRYWGKNSRRIIPREDR